MSKKELNVIDQASELLYLAKLTDIEQIDRELSLRRYSHFIRCMWPLIDPKDYIHNWHIDAICDHLQATYTRDILRLMINVPPRHMKSIATAVGFPAWVWAQPTNFEGKPGAVEQFFYASYAHSLAVRDSRKCRNLIQSNRYQKWFGNAFNLSEDQNTKVKFENSHQGYRYSTSVDGPATGEGGDTIVIDDAHNVKEADSPVKREGVLDWWDETMPTRHNDSKTGVYIIIGQRVHDMDLCGKIKEEEEDGGDEYVHLNLPARLEKSEKCSTVYINMKGKEIRWEDPRTEEGELLCPERFPEDKLDKLEIKLGVYATAAQHQQRPTPREGGTFQPDNMEIVLRAPSPIIKLIRYWDKAGSVKKGSAFSAGFLLGEMESGCWIALDVVRGQWRAEKREAVIKETAEMDSQLGHNCSYTVGIEQEPGSGGLESAESTVRNLSGFHVVVDLPSGDKEVRAYPVASQINVGNIYLLKGIWNKVYLDELRTFPKAQLKDQVDATSGAYKLIDGRHQAGVW